MAKRKKIFTLSSEKEKEIEKNYVNTKQGKFIYLMMLINTIVLLIALLLSLYQLVCEFSGMGVDINITKISNKFMIFSSIIVLVCLYYYISYSNRLLGRRKERSKAESKRK